MFGVYARNIIAGQGRYTPEKENSKTGKPNEYHKTLKNFHLVKQPCPGCCHKDTCANSFCQAHPTFKRGAS